MHILIRDADPACFRPLEIHSREQLWQMEQSRDDQGLKKPYIFLFCASSLLNWEASFASDLWEFQFSYN